MEYICVLLFGGILGAAIGDLSTVLLTVFMLTLWVLIPYALGFWLGTLWCGGLLLLAKYLEVR